MVRRADGVWELSLKEAKGMIMLWPLLQIVFGAGAAWAGVRYGLEGKADKSEIVEQKIELAAHVNASTLQFQSLRTADSSLAMQLIQSRQAELDNQQRIREIVCYKSAIPACR